MSTVGYQAVFTGKITIDPPLTWAEVLTPLSHPLEDLRIATHEEVTNTDVARTTVITGVAVAPVYTPAAGYNMMEDLQALVDAHGRGHRFTGYIEAVGEDGDRWRLLVRDGHAEQIYPRLVWPGDGDPE